MSKSLMPSACETCPFEYDSRCDHPSCPEEHYGFGALTAHRFPGQKAPDWCPLRKRPVLVQLKESP